MTEIIEKKDFENLKEQLNNVFGDKDRIRIAKNAARSYKFTSEQVAELVKIQRMGEGKIQSAIILYDAITDKENFEKMVISVFRYDDEKQQIRDALKL